MYFNHFNQGNIWSIIYLNYGEKYEDMIDHRNWSSCEIKVHLTPKFLFGRDETVQLSHKEFANFISMWYF